MLRRVLAITLVGSSLVVAACGSDDDSPESSRSAAGATGSTGPTSQIPPVPENPAGAQGERGSGSGASSRGDGSSGRDGPGKDRSPRKGGSRKRGRDRPGFSAPGTSPGPPGGRPLGAAQDPPPLATSDASAYRLAKEICANVTLEGIALNLRINLEERDAEFVARAFSRGYPAAHRDAAYRGCLEGFRNPVKPR